MATQADIPAPICEKIREEGENIVYQATNILLHKPPQEENTPNEPPTIEGEIFLTTPSISEVHYVSKNISPNAIKEDEKLNVEVAISQDKKIKEEIPCKEEYIPIEKVDGAVITPEDPGMLLEKSANKSQGDLEIQSKPLEEIVTNHSNPEVTEKANESSLIQVGDSQVECDEKLKMESEKLPLTEALAECTNGNESTVIHKVKNEDEDLGKAEIFENEESTCNLLKEEALQEPVESLHIAPEDITASNQGQDTKTSSLEEGSINANLQGITSDHTDEKTIVTQSEVDEVQKFSSIVSNEEIEENSIIKVDSPKTKNEEHLEKEIQEMSSPQPLAREDSGDESKVIPEAQANDGDLRIAELCKNEFSTENIVLKTESKIDEPVESVHVYPEDINASALGQEIEKTSSEEEQTLTADPQGTLDEETDRTVDAVEAEETLEVQNVATIVSNEKTDEDYSLIQINDSQLRDEDLLEKESEKTSFIKHSTLDANDDELTVTPEVKFEEENPKGAELFEREKTIESTSFTEEVQLEKPVESYHEAVDDIKASALDQHTEITSSTDENDLTENTQKILCDEAEEKTIDVADTKEEILHLQDVGVDVSNKDIGENALIQVDDSQLKHEEHLEEEIGNPSIIEALAEDANDESTTVHEVKNETEEKTEENIESTLLEKKVMTEKPIEYLQVAHEDNKLSASSDTEIACSSEEQSEIANSQAIMDDKALHSIENEEVTLAVQNVETIIAHEETEENPKNQVDCSQMENEEHLEKEIENPSLKDSSKGDVKEDESKTTQEPEILYEDPIKAELLENEKNIETTSEKDEAQIAKSVDSLPKAVDDIKASASGHDTETSPIEEKIPTLNPQEVICVETEEKTIEAADIKDETLAIENVAIDVPNEDIEKNSSIPLEASQIEHEVHLEKEIEKPSFTEAPIEGANDDGTIIIHEAKIEDACLRNVELFDNDTNIDNSLLKKEATVEKPIEDLQVAAEDNKAFTSSDDAKTTYSLEEQIPNAQGTVDEKIINATEEVTLEVENVATSILHGETQENSLSQVDLLQTENEEHLEKESENPTLEESSTGDTNEDESKTMHEPEIKEEKLTKAELLEKEKKIESTLENEETLTDKSIDLFQVATKDIEASASGQDTQTSSIEEQILTVKPQEIFCGETEEKTIDAADAKDETLAIENIEINVSNEGIDKNSSFQVDDSQIEHEARLENEIEKPSLIEASTKSTIDDESIIVHDANIGNACLEIVGLCDKDKNIDNSLLKENAPVEKPTEDLQVAAEDSKELVSSEDTKTNYSLEEQMANAQGTVEEKTIDATEEVTPEIENVATSIPHGEAQENSLIQAICPQNEYEGNLEKEIENPSLAEASIGNTNEDGLRAIHEPEIRDEELIKAELKENDKNAESTLVKEEVLIENPIDTLQVDTEDIKASFSDRDTETSPIHEQILIVNPKEISDNKTEEKTIDAVDTEVEILENVLTNVADGDNEDNSENQIDRSQIKHEEHFEKENEKPSVAEASMGNNNDDKSTVHEVKIVNEDLIKEHLSENEKNVGSSLVKAASIESLQVAPQVIKASDSGLDRETSSLEEQCLTITPQEIKDDNKEDETAAQKNEEIPEDKIVARDVANEDTVENSLIQVDESNTHMETESEKLDRNANDESKIMHEASTLEEGLKAKDNEICTGREDHMKDVANQENQDNPVTSNGVTEDQSKLKENDSNDVGQLTEEKVDEDSEITVRGDDVEMQNTDNQHYVEAHSEAKEDETIKISSEVVEIYEESNNEEIKVEASNEDEKKEMEPESEVSKETENADNNAKTTKINEEEGYLKDLQMTTAVDIADHEENGSDSITAEIPCAKGLDVNQDTVDTVVEGPNCEQEELFTTDVSEEDTRNVVNTTSLASEASKVNREQTDVENMAGLDDVSAIKPANENLVEAYQKESTESQAPDGEKEAEIMQRDLEAETGEKEIKDEQPINASLDVSETNELNGLEENRNSDSCKEISVNSNTVALEEGETQKQHDDHILANIHSLSTGKTEDDVPLCGATVDESDIPEQMKKIDETSLPAPDENMIDETDTNKVEVAENAKDKYVEHLEQEDATKIFLNDQNPPESEHEEAQCRQEKVMLAKETEGIKDSTSILAVNDFLQASSKETSEVGSFTTERDLTINSEVLCIDKTASGEDQEEEANKQNVPDLITAAPVMTEAKLLYEAPEETSICKVAGEGNIVNETSDTTESTVINNNTDLEDIHVNSKSIEELDTKLEDDAPETKEATWDATKGQEVEVASVWESSGLISERTENEHAFVEGIEERSNSNELEVEQRENKAGYDFKDEVVRELKSQVQEDHTEGVTRGNQTGDETKGASTEEVTEDNITSVPKNEIQKVVLLYDDQETSLEIEKSKDENTSKMPSGVEEKSMELGQEGSLKDEEILNYKVDDVIDSNTVSKEIHDPENLEKILESTAQVENFEKISKAEEVKTEEENLEATKEIKSDQIVSEEKIEPKETTYEAEATMKINILSEKIEKDGEDVQEYHLGSCKEDVFVQSHPEDVIKQEEQIYKEENFEVIKNASENVKECEVIDEVNDKAVEEPENTLCATESINQKEHVVSVEEITTSFDTEKEAHGLDHVCIKKGTEGSSEKVNSSDVAVLEDENNRKGADDIETEMTKDDGLQIEDSKIPDIDAVARELPELDQNILCEDAPTTAVHITVEASEGNEGYVNTNIIQQQQVDDNNKHESFPLPEFTQGKETEKQDEKDENCSSDEVQAKEEENMILAAGTRQEDEQKADTCSEPIENEDRNTYIETEKLGYTLDTTDKSEVSHSYGTQDIPKDNENYPAKGESSQEKYPNESTESQISTFSEDIELIEQDSKATTSAAAVVEETGRVSQQAEEVSDECEGTKTSKSIESTEIFTSKIMEDYTVRTSLGIENQETQDQLTELHDVPQEPHVKDCEVKMAEKDDQVGIQSVSDIRENMQELNEGSTEVSKEENDLPQESYIKDSEPEMTEKDGPVDLQCVSNIREDVHELNESKAEVSKEENPVVADPSENIEGKCSGGGQEADAVRNFPISETLKQEIEEQPISEVNGMNCGEEKKINENCNDSTQTSHIVTKEMVSETKTHQSYMEDAAQSARNHELQMKIDSLPISPSIKCSDTEIAEKDDAKEEVTHLSAEDIQSVPEADHIKNVNPEIGDTNILVIQREAPTDCYQEESEILKPSITEQGEAKCHDEVKSSEKSESTEIDESSLSDLLQVSVKETSKTDDHSASEKEPTIHGEYLHVEKPKETEPEETKTDEEKDNEEESCEQKTSDLGSEAPVIVDAGDADVKVAHKKSHNILSGVGSKVKHSIAKVKKVITGKSSHPKPPSPKSGEKC